MKRRLHREALPSAWSRGSWPLAIVLSGTAVVAVALYAFGVSEKAPKPVDPPEYVAPRISKEDAEFLARIEREEMELAIKNAIAEAQEDQRRKAAARAYEDQERRNRLKQDLDEIRRERERERRRGY